MQVTKQINSTRFNTSTKEVEVVDKFALTGVIDSDYEFTVDSIVMNGTEISGDEFFVVIGELPNGLDFFWGMMEQRFEVAEIYIKTSRFVEVHTPVAFVE